MNQQGIGWHARLEQWQFFATLTFRALEPSRPAKARMMFAWLREVANGHPSMSHEQGPRLAVKWHRLGWLARGELGEVGGRHHFHILICGLPARRVNPSECFWQMNLWETLGGGMARVRMFSARSTGVEYVLKGLEDAPSSRDGANAYELSKFDAEAPGRELILAESLLRKWRRGSRGEGRRWTRDGKSARRDRIAARGPVKTWAPKMFPHPADSPGARLVV